MIIRSVGGMVSPAFRHSLVSCRAKPHTSLFIGNNNNSSSSSAKFVFSRLPLTPFQSSMATMSHQAARSLIINFSTRSLISFLPEVLLALQPNLTYLPRLFRFVPLGILAHFLYVFCSHKLLERAKHFCKLRY